MCLWLMNAESFAAVNVHLFSDYKEEHSTASQHREEKDRRHKERRHHVGLSSSSTCCVLCFFHITSLHCFQQHDIVFRRKSGSIGETGATTGA